MSFTTNSFFQYNKESAPVLLWLQGGPGGSSMFGLFNEHGPLQITKDLQVLKRHTAWSATHHLVYFDNPVGTGFSYTKLDKCFAQNEDNVASDMYNALTQFFQMFPNLKKHDFYVTGESYAGKYVPAIAHHIHVMNPKNDKAKFINLKGIAIGDGLCDPITMTDYGDFLFSIGLIDELDRKAFKDYAHRQIEAIKKKKWVTAFQIFDDLLNGDLSGHPSYFTNSTGFHYYFNYLVTKDPEDQAYYAKFLQLPQVRKAIHVGNLTFNDGQDVEKHLLSDVMQSVKPLVEDLKDHYRYFGHLS